MSADKTLIRRARRALIALAALSLALTACEYRPERNAQSQEKKSHEPAPSKSSGDPAITSTEGLPVEEPTNAPPKAVGRFTIKTLAGSGTPTWADGMGAKASFVTPIALVGTDNGDFIVADSGGNRIRRVTPEGEVTTIAGDGTAGFKDGPAATARFNGPRGVAIGSDGTIYVADSGNHVVRAISPAGAVSTLAGSAGKRGFKNAPGTNAQFNAPIGITSTKDGTLYVTEFENHAIRLISKTGLVRTLAGTGRKGFKDGPAGQSQFDSPVGIVVDAKGTVYVADAANNRVRTIAAGTVKTLAGSKVGLADGTGVNAKLNLPYGLTFGTNGVLFVTEFGNDSIRRIDAKGVVKTIILPPPPKKPPASASPSTSGDDSLARPAGIVFADGRFYVADSGSAKIRIVSSRD